MAEVIKEVGLTPEDIDMFSNDPAGLIKVRAIYASLCESAKGQNSLSTEETAQYREQAKKNENAQEQAKNMLSTFWDSYCDAFDAEQDSIFLMIEGIEEYLSIIKFEAKELIRNVGVSNTDRATRNTDAATKYALLEKLQDLIGAIWKVQKDNLKLTDKAVFGEKGTFPLKDTKANGLMPDLPRMPDKPGTEKKGKGRPIHSSYLRFKWQAKGEKEFKDVPENMNAAEVARQLVSDRKAGVVENWSNMKKRLNEAKVDITKDDWQLDYPTGVLKGYIDKSKEVVSSGKAEKEAKGNA